ncbi:MAG: LuxR C-terminal-related transcriptional regulator [Crocinitomicaceae bacterium]
MSFAKVGNCQHQEMLDSLMSIDAKELPVQERCRLYYSRSWYSFSLANYSGTCDQAKKALSLSKENNFDTLVSKSSLIVGSAFVNKFEYDSAIYYLRDGYHYLDNYHPNEFAQEKTRINVVLGDALANKLRYTEATLVHEENLKISRNLKDTAAIVTSLLSLARLHKDVGLYSTSLELLTQCKSYTSNVNHRNQKSRIFGFSASVQAKMEDFPKAIRTYKKAIGVERSIPEKNEMVIGEFYFNMSEIYFDMKHFDSAFFALNKAQKIFQENGASYHNTAAQIREAKILIETGEYTDALRRLDVLQNVHPSLKPEFYINYSLALEQKNEMGLAIQYADSSRIYADERKDLFALKFAYKNLSDLYEKEQNWEMAFQFKRDFEFMTDSLLKIKELRDVQKIEVNEIYAEKNAVINNKEKQLKKEKSSKEQLRLILLAVVALIVILVLIFIVRSKAQKTKLVEAENTRLKMERETEELKKEMQDHSLDGLKNLQFIEMINEKVVHLKNHEVAKAEITDLKVTIKQFLLKSQKEEVYKNKINLIETSFFEKIEQLAKLSKTEKKLCTFLKLEMSSKEISDFLNVSEKTVEVYRSRLRKKLNIPSDMSFERFFTQL